MNITIRPFEIEDALALQQISKHPFFTKERIWEYIFPNTFLNAVALVKFYQDADKQRFLIRAVCVNQRLCGLMQCECKTQSSCELSYWLDCSYWNKGIMSKALERMVKEAFFELPIISIYARVNANNIASQRVLERNAFKKEEYEDLYIYHYYR